MAKSVSTEKRTPKILLGSILLLAMLAPGQMPPSYPNSEPLDSLTLDGLRTLYKQLIEAENRHDLAAVEPLVWNSPSTLFVAKTATLAEGNWAGFWGTDVVMQHFHDLYQGPFRIDPDYSKEKVVGLTADVAETYVPVNITVAYAGQTPVPKPFLMILDWIKTPAGWKMATDIALPIPSAPPHPNRFPKHAFASLIIRNSRKDITYASITKTS
jgi:hypothetical protein